MNIIELSEIQQLLFSIEQEKIEEICSIIIGSNYFENNEKRNLLLSNFSLLIDLRPKQFDEIIDLCILLNKFDPTNSFSSQLLNRLLDKLSQEQQYFIFKGYHYELFPFFLIISSIEYLINSSQEKKAYSLGRWFTEELREQDRMLFGKILSFNFLRSSEADLLKSTKNEDFLLGIRSKLPDDLLLYDVLRNDDIEKLLSLIKPFSDIMIKKRHLLPVGSIYSQLTESSVLLDESLSVFDICAYYNSINCFEKLCQLTETNSKYMQSLSQEKIKSFNVMHYAIAGGSIQIILSLFDHKFPIDDCIQCAIYFHRNELIDFFSEIDKEVPSNPMQLLNSSKDVWGTPLFQSCHSNNIEIFLQMIHYKSFQTSLNIPVSMPASPSSLFPNPFFYDFNLYLFIYDNIIKSQEAIGKDIEKGNEPYFKFKDINDADSYMSLLLSSIKYSKEMLVNGLFYLTKKGYIEILELMIKELLKTSKLTERLINEMSDHVHDDVFQFVFDLNITDQYGNTILITASKFNQISCVKLLINIYQVLQDLSELDEENENESNFSYLNIDAVNNEGRSALDYACFNGNYEIVELLLATGQISIENLHKSLIACLRNCSYCNAHSRKKIIQEFYFNINVYNILYPYSFVDPPNYGACISNGRKLSDKCELCYERIINSLLNALQHTAKTSLMDSSSSDILSMNSSDENISEKSQIPSICFSVYLKTIEKYSIENDDVEIFQILMNTPETLKSLSKTRCVEIINDAIDHNSINILKYIFSNLDKKNNNDKIVNRCPITVDTKMNFLRKAISANKYDVSVFLYSLGLFDLAYDDIFLGLKDPEIIRLIFEQNPDLILNNINTKGKNNQTLLTQAAKDKYVDSFKFLQSLPSVNINAIGKEHDPINYAYLSYCDNIFLMCIKHPTINMKLSSFGPLEALERVIYTGDAMCAKLILDIHPNIDITERTQVARVDYYDYRQYKKYGQSLMDIAYNYDRKNIIDYFNYFLAKNNRPPYSPQKSGVLKDNKKKVELREEDLKIEKSIIEDDLESVKKLINKDNVNMHFERNGMTPLSTAIQFEFIDIIQYLLTIPEIDVNLPNDGRPRNEYIKYPEKTEYKIDVYQPTIIAAGETPLITAIKTMNIEIVKLLLAVKSIDVNKESKDQTLTPLTQAIKYKRLNNYYSLKPDKKVATLGQQKTPEQVAIEESNGQFIINLLLNADGIDVNKKTKNSVPLCEAVKAKQLETVKLMCDLFTNLPEDSKKSKLDLDQVDNLKKTAIEQANDEAIKKILLDHGAKEVKTEKKFARYTKDNLKIGAPQDENAPKSQPVHLNSSKWSHKNANSSSSSSVSSTSAIKKGAERAGWTSSSTTISNQFSKSSTESANNNDDGTETDKKTNFLNLNKKTDKKQGPTTTSFKDKFNFPNSLKPSSENPTDKQPHKNFLSQGAPFPAETIRDKNSKRLDGIINDKNKKSDTKVIIGSLHKRGKFSVSYSEPNKQHVWNHQLNTKTNGWGGTTHNAGEKKPTFSFINGWQKNKDAKASENNNEAAAKEQDQSPENVEKDANENEEVVDKEENQQNQEDNKDDAVETKSTSTPE